MKIGRNDPCPCGSGDKYKKCCEARDAEVRSAELAAEAQAQAELAELALAAGDTPASLEQRPNFIAGSNTLRPPKNTLPPNRATSQKRKV